MAEDADSDGTGVEDDGEDGLIAFASEDFGQVDQDKGAEAGRWGWSKRWPGVPGESPRGPAVVARRSCAAVLERFGGG